MITITKAELKTTKPPGNKPYKSIEFSDARKATMWPTDKDGNETPGYSTAVTGAVGDAEITSNEQGGKTYYNVISWQTKAGTAQASHGGDDPWPAKDRGMDCQSAYKSAGHIVTALIASGAIKTLVDAQAAWDTLATQVYGVMQDARAGKLVYNGFDPTKADGYDPYADIPPNE